MTEDCIRKEDFIDILKNDLEDFFEIEKFSIVPGSGAGENYSSVMYRVHIEIKLKDDSCTFRSYMLKLVPEIGTDSYEYIKNGNHFPKENKMYEKIIPALESLYSEKESNVSFGPRKYSFQSISEAVVTEDLCPEGYSNANRLEGLDEKHCKAVLKKIAKFHAASAVLFEKCGSYDEEFNTNLFVESSRPIFMDFNKHIMESMEPCIRKLCKNGDYYAKKFIKKDIKDYVDHLMDSEKINTNEFNVLNHGDLWANNILFKYNEDNEICDTKLIDFQICKYGSPALDLYYFIISSAKLELKVEKFDEFINFYHIHLTENLKLLEYSKPIPTLSDLHNSLLSHGIWARLPLCGVLAAALLDPNGNASMDNFISEDCEDNNFKSVMYSNPRYIEALNVLLPWLDGRGILNREE